MNGRIGAGKLHTSRRQPVGVPWRAASFNWLLPFCFKMSLRFQADEERIERAGFHISAARQFIAVRPLAIGIEQDGKHHPGVRGQGTCSRHDQ
ncbi:hypothetical protein IH86_14310 [Sphingobium yanoikuyae]|nr:hypothetical protein IH86_14310 [Sphingobium yanoikuyae]